MTFDELDQRMRGFETSHDRRVPPAVWMVARLDGRSFTRLTKNVCDFDRPFDERFRDAMVATAGHLMSCGPRVVYGYTESDEISLLLHPDDGTFDRKTRKLNSVLAGEASALFSRRLDLHASFDCRISELPGQREVVDYFRWRAEDAFRNALNAHVYWKLRERGERPRAAQRAIDGRSHEEKVAMLTHMGVTFADVPQWQRRGVGLVWESYEKEAINPLTGETVWARRQRVRADLSLPSGDSYGHYLAGLLVDSAPDSLAHGPGK